MRQKVQQSFSEEVNSTVVAMVTSSSSGQDEQAGNVSFSTNETFNNPFSFPAALFAARAHKYPHPVSQRSNKAIGEMSRADA